MKGGSGRSEGGEALGIGRWFRDLGVRCLHLRRLVVGGYREEESLSRMRWSTAQDCGGSREPLERPRGYRGS